MKNKNTREEANKKKVIERKSEIKLLSLVVVMNYRITILCCYATEQNEGNVMLWSKPVDCKIIYE